MVRVTRIIAGAAGSVALRVPARGTRPTSDRVREALFGALDARDAIDGAHVLDLFAGSGALGLEAASRGAGSVVLVDRASTATRVAAQNAAAVAGAGAAQARVVTSTAAAFLTANRERFDLVFIDPPYDIPGDELDAVLALLEPALEESALVVLESSRRSGPPRLPDSLSLERTRVYGDTAIHWIAAR